MGMPDLSANRRNASRDAPPSEGARRSLAPFDDAGRFGKSFKPNLLVIDGLDLAAGIEVGTVGHDASRVLLTGSGAHGKHASSAQYLALERGNGIDSWRARLR